MNIHKLRRMTARIPRNIERKNAPSGETPEQKLTREILEIKTSIITAIQAKADLATVTEMQRQLDALDIKLAERHAGGGPGETLQSLLEKNEGVQRLLKDKRGASATVEIPANMLERKTAIDSNTVGRMTSGVLTIDRTPGIVPEARQRLMLRDALTSRPTTMQRIDFIRVNSPMTAASPQYVEGHTKKENATTFTTTKEDVTTISTWIPASRQVLDDLSELMGFLQTGLSYYVDLAEETGLISGSGVGAELHGLVTVATAFDTNLLSASAGWQRIDIIGRVIQQITTAKETQPTFIALNPVDFWAIKLTKDSYGRYLSNSMDVFWGLTPIVTTSIASGTFLVGSGSPVACEIRDRMAMTVEISTSHSTFFTENMVAILAEKRLALVTYRPASFITGNFSSSP